MNRQQQLNLAQEHRQAGRLHEAEVIYRQILAEKPDDPDTWHSLGTVLARQGQTIAALVPLRQAVTLAPGRPEFQHYLALVLEMTDQFDQAVELHRNVLAMAQAYAAQSDKADIDKPMLGQMHFHLAFALEIAGQLEESETHYRQAISLNPNNFAARVNFPMLLLKKNKFDQAWQEFFTGLAIGDPLRLAYPKKRWDGSNPTGKRILISADGHFGDTLLLARFVPMLQRRGAHVILQCQPALLPLLAPLADEAIAVGAPLPDFDFYAPLAALPLVLGFTTHPVPSGCPYLSPPTDRHTAWADRIPRDGVMNIGLVWAGGEGDRSRFRSHSLQILAPLAEVTPVRFLSLQKGPHASEKPPPGMQLIDFTAELRDFADTAALIGQLDLVIGVDTAVMHIAAAQNKPTWVLIPWRTSFLWLLDRADSPWYPTMKLFRQPKGSDWKTPVQQMAQSLRSLIAAKSA
jgi:Tfp pilus assembly protein PilF